jgi:hypothetical protein
MRDVNVGEWREREREMWKESERIGEKKRETWRGKKGERETNI